GYAASTDVPVIKAALLALYEAWPRCVPFDDLWRAVRARLPAPPGDEARSGLAEALAQCWLTSLVEVHATPPPLCLTVSERPVAFSVARFQAKAGASGVCNLRHRTVPLDDVDRKLVSLLDGTRDRAALAREMGTEVALDER